MKWDIRKFIRQAAAAAVAGAMALSISMPALAETWDLSNGSVYITGYDDYATVIQNRTDGLVAASSNVYFNSGETIELTGTYTGAGPGIKVDLSDGNVPIVLNGAEINATTSEAINVYHNAPSFHKLTLNLQGTNKLSGLYAIYSNEERAGLIFDGSKGGKLEASATGEYVIYAYYATLQNGADLTLQGDQHFMGYYDGSSYRELAADSGLEQEEETTLTKTGVPYGIRISTDGGTSWIEVDSRNYNDILGNGVLQLQEKNDGTYMLFKNAPLNTGLRIDATEAESAGKTVDVWLVSDIRGDLTISGVRNVTMPNLNNSPITGDASITCSGNVEIYRTMAGSLTVNRANDVTVTKNISGDAKISCTGDVEIACPVNGSLTVTNAANVTVDGNIDGSVEISCTGDVNLINSSDSAGYSVIQKNFTVKNAANVTVDGNINDSAEISCTGDVKITSQICNDLFVTNAANVTVNGNVGGNAEVSCTGDVNISSPSDSDYSYVVSGDLTVNDAANVTVSARSTRNLYQNAVYGSVNIENCTGDVTLKGASAIWGDFKSKDSSIHCDKKLTINGDVYGGQISTNAGSVEINGSVQSTSLSITANSDVTITSNYFSCTIQTINPAEITCGGKLSISNSSTGFAVAGDLDVQKATEVTLQGGKGARAVTGDLTFDAPSGSTFKLERGTSAADITETTIAGTEPYSLSDSYIHIAPVETYQLGAPEGTVTAMGSISNPTPYQLDHVLAGTIITLKTDSTMYGYQFKGWIGFPEGMTFLNGTSAATETVTFRMPAQNVTVTATYENKSTENPDQPGGPGSGTDPDPGDPDPTPDIPDPGAGAGVSDGEMFATGVALTAAGGTVLLGGYFLATELILNHLLPEGAAIPANRAQLALLVWQTAGSPEPAAVPAFADITDAATAKAAQWCIEQGYLKAKADGTFDANGWTPRFQTIQVWNKAFPNGSNQNHAA